MQDHTQRRNRTATTQVRPRIERFRIHELPISVGIAVSGGAVQFVAATVSSDRKWETTSRVDHVPGKFRQNVLARQLAQQLADHVIEARENA